MTDAVTQIVQRQADLPIEDVSQDETTVARKAIPSRTSAEAEIESQLRPMKYQVPWRSND